ncbi:MAG TPA: hypothetical protein VJ746_16450 [Nitrospira sp.]|nr:hypothetical protein [Nitrospira sp.]
MNRIPTAGTGDVKEMMIAGCRVRLAYRSAGDGRWTVLGTVQCGLDEKSTTQTVLTDSFGSREEAERTAITRITSLLGEQVDRSHSRVRNWS